ncbi:AMP-binding protein [Nocardia sp. NPDC127526]|uniref:AMP-binding protein n=1 Tax=Nocardia sp. NPDC127526 TaxID=3345393 RepID=UPI00362DA2D7
MPRTQLLLPLPVLLTRRAARLGDAVAFRDRWRTIGFRALADRTARLAGHLGDAGLVRGEPVPIMTGNRVETIEAMLAVARAGGLGLPLPSSRRLPQSASPTARFAFTLGDYPELRHYSGRTVTLEDLAATAPRHLPRDLADVDQPAWIVRTGATQLVATQRSTVWSVLSCLDLLLPRDRAPLPVPLPYGCAHLICLLAVLALGGSAHLSSPPLADPTGYALLEHIDARRENGDARPHLGLTTPAATASSLGIREGTRLSPILDQPVPDRIVHGAHPLPVEIGTDLLGRVPG